MTSSPEIDWPELGRVANAPLDTSWMADSACAAMPGLPWIDCSSRVPPFVVELMAEACAHCPVLARCAAFVEEAGITAGYWAGQSQEHRSQLEDAVADSVPWEAA